MLHSFPRAFARMFALSFLVSLIIAASPLGGAAAENGEHLMQCQCPVSWWGDWDGNGTFDEAASLDTIVLVNGPITVIMHELPIETATVDTLIDDRQASLESSTRISDLETVWATGVEDIAEAGRRWTSPDGVTMVSVQLSQIWESDYILSMEFIAPAEDLEDSWVLREDIQLGDHPVFDFTDLDIVLEYFGL